MTLQVISGNTVVYWHHTDRQGSVIATSDAAGQIVSAAAYRARSDIPHERDLPPTGSPCGYSLSFGDIEGLLARRGIHVSQRARSICDKRERIPQLFQHRQRVPHPSFRPGSAPM